jgi:hypothetical protein
MIAWWPGLLSTDHHALSGPIGGDSAIAELTGKACLVTGEIARHRPGDRFE